MTKLFTVFFVNACKYGELFVSLSFARSKNSNKYLDFYSLIRIFAVYN